MTPTQKAVEAAARAIASFHATGVPNGWSQARIDKAVAKAALTAALAVDGLCLVAKEPTMAMLAAGETAWINDPLKRSSTLYRAMIAAASDGDSPRQEKP